MDSSKPQQTPFEQFVDSLIEEKGYVQIADEVKAEIKKDLMLRLDDFIAARIIASLSDDDLDAFEKLLDSNPQMEEIQRFAGEKIPEFADFLTNVLLEFRAVYLGMIQPAEPEDIANLEDAHADAGSQVGAQSIGAQDLDADLVHTARENSKEDDLPPAPVN